MTYPVQRTTPGGADRNSENRLIGVELTFLGRGGAEELMMLVPPGGYFALPKNFNYGDQMQVTLHTSDGDRGGRIDL